MKTCKVCNITKDDGEFYVRNKSTCIECKNARDTKHLALRRERDPETEKARRKKYARNPSNRFSDCKFRAKKRGIEWALSLEQYCSTLGNPCFYCNNELCLPSEVSFGLDRIDNNIHYTIDNVVSCCKICNSIKHDKLSVSETKAVVSAILVFRRSNGIHSPKTMNGWRLSADDNSV